MALSGPVPGPRHDADHQRHPRARLSRAEIALLTAPATIVAADGQCGSDAASPSVRALAVKKSCWTGKRQVYPNRRDRTACVLARTHCAFVRLELDDEAADERQHPPRARGR